jgi:hypothetical protein
MWESVERLVESGKGWFVLIIIALMVFAIRQGYMKVKTEKIMIGRDFGERERSILKNQMDYAYRMCTGFINEIPRFEGFDEFRAKYIIELCYDEFVKWININHIENKKGYIENKQDIIWNVIQANVHHKKLTSDQFKKEVDEKVAHIIEQLVSIREEYKQ